jgi:hypothetical protein
VEQFLNPNLNLNLNILLKLPSEQHLHALLWLYPFVFDFLTRTQELLAISFLPFLKPSAFLSSPSSLPLYLWQEFSPSGPASLSAA